MIAQTQGASNQLGISGKSLYSPRPVGISLDGRYRGLELRYSLQRQARSLCYDPSKQAGEQHPVVWCHNGVANAGDSIAVKRQVSGDSARLNGVTTCKSVWACPICSARICAARQVEVAAAMKAHIDQGGYVFLMTRTFPHELDMPVAELLEKEARARALFRNSRRWRAGKNARTGYICSLEVTRGENGWHPHTHELVFATPEAFGDTREVEHGKLVSRVIDELKETWYDCLRKVGLCAPEQMSDVMNHGLDVRGGQWAAEYVAKFGRDQKWGMSREITKHAAKTGGGSQGLHPFQLLDFSMRGDQVAGDLFREYVAAFQGKRMLSWSKGLKKLLLGVEEMTDEEAEERALPEEIVVAHITSVELAILSKRRLLGNFLGFVAEHCADLATTKDDIAAYMEWAQTVTPSGSGVVKVKMWSRSPQDPIFKKPGRGFMFVDQETRYA
jgi:hypothetical protein